MNISSVEIPCHSKQRDRKGLLAAAEKHSVGTMNLNSSGRELKSRYADEMLLSKTETALFLSEIQMIVTLVCSVRQC